MGAVYKYEIKFKNGDPALKADPYANYAELRPNTASIVWDLDEYKWNDQDWMKKRAALDTKTAPMSIYEVHLGSWMRKQIEVDKRGREIVGSEFYNYREIAVKLAEYVKEMGYSPCGTSAGHGTSAGCFVGLSGDRILRTDQPLRHTG